MTPRLLPALAALALPGVLAAQSINVVVNRSLRPTAVLGPHVRYVVAADTDGVLTINELSIPPVAFAGSIRIEGAEPGSRAPGRHPFADTVRFEPEGRVAISLADAAGRPPLAVEVVGARGAAGGRIAITSPRWPLGRVLVVTIVPADLYELSFRATGLGVRDRIRVDDRAGFAYLSDSTAGPTTVALGFGRGATGRIQGEATTLLLSRDYEGQQGTERRTLGGLTMIIEPSRSDDGFARAEIIFGVGNSEAEAMRAARTASDEPLAAPRASNLRWDTPSGDADVLVRHLQGAAGWMLDWDVLNGERAIPASALHPGVRAIEAAQGAVLALQRGDAAAVCGSWRLLRPASAFRPAHLELAPRLGAQGRYLAERDSAGADAAWILLAHACYAATRDTTMLRGALPLLTAATQRLITSGGELEADALDRAAELFDEGARITPGRSTAGDSLRAEAARLRERNAPIAGALWRALFSQAQAGIGRDYGRMSGTPAAAGMSFGAGGALINGIVGGIYGIRERLDRIEIAPQLAGIDDAHAWSIDGWLLSTGDTLGMTYRPSTRSADIRLTAAAHRTRLSLRFPWLTATSCVMVRRGSENERLSLVQQSDGWLYVDVRATFDPAVVRVSAEGCAGS